MLRIAGRFGVQETWRVQWSHQQWGKVASEDSFREKTGNSQFERWLGKAVRCVSGVQGN
jgi:hypothetical protein